MFIRYKYNQTYVKKPEKENKGLLWNEKALFMLNQELEVMSLRI